MTGQLKALLRDVVEFRRFQSRFPADPCSLAADNFDRKLRLLLAVGAPPKDGSVGANVIAELRTAIASLRVA